MCFLKWIIPSTQDKGIIVLILVRQTHRQGTEHEVLFPEVSALLRASKTYTEDVFLKEFTLCPRNS